MTEIDEAGAGASDTERLEANNEALELEEQERESAEPLDITADERRLVTQPYDFSVGTLVENVNSERMLLELRYQRKYVWDDGKASRLIESLLLNVPIPVVYLAETEDGVLEVVDGQQRLRSIWRFISDKVPEDEQLVLRGLPVLAELNGLRFTELASRDQRRLLNRTVRCIVITEDSHPDIKFDVFERLNTGAVALTDQELRNSIYRGPLNDAITEAAAYEPFQHVLDGQFGARMADVELVLRFIALADRLNGYKPPLRQFLNEYMRDHRQGGGAVDVLLVAFSRTIDTVGTVFGTDAFRAPGSRQINKALFDATMQSFQLADQGALAERRDDVRLGLSELQAAPEFEPLVGRATADRTRMFGRIAAFSVVISELGIPTRFREVLPEIA